MKHPVNNIDLEKKIFAASTENFSSLALELFQFQYENNGVYRQYCDNLHINATEVNDIEKIPFLPVCFFKTHLVKTTEFDAALAFESSGTTQMGNSQHLIKNGQLYRKSFTATFEKFYGPIRDKCILGLLPSYLEKQQSSLVTMVDGLIKASNNTLSGFYLYDYEKLHRTLLHNELLKLPTILIGVTYALLDFAAQFPMQLRHTIVMETGGMKGRRKEITRQEVHEQLQLKLGVSVVHSEYGMTELLSQAYSKGNGIFHCPPWMKILIREEDDPLHVSKVKEKKEVPINGFINIIDLANIYSCAFIATEDMGSLHANGSFEIWGRKDHSDVRGCGLMLL